jgi:uncharacterized repeat protein (TIGR03803 family)
MINVGSAIGSLSFTLTCRGSGGTISQSVTVTIQDSVPAPDLTFRANPPTVVSGTNTTLTWSSNGAECTASGGWTGAKAPNGTESVGPITTQTDYVLSCQSPGSLVHTAMLTVRVTAPEPLYSLLYKFTGGEDGANPYGLIVDEAGNLYGTTYSGGRFCVDAFDSCGTVFKLDPNGILTTLHVFAGGANDGASPRAGLVRDEAGNIYGGTYLGGAHRSGVVFKLGPSGKLTVLHHFNEGVDGIAPEVGFRDDVGNLYGTTGLKGTLERCLGKCGSVFKLSSAGKLTTLYMFNGRDGDEPSAPVIRDAAGNLYGTTARGGGVAACDPLGCGTVFKLAPNGDLTTLHAFIGSDGDTPTGRLSRDEAGNLYGTTVGGSQGFGTVYRLDVRSQMTVLLSYLAGDPLGAHPEGGVVLDSAGNIYGATRSGGPNGWGVLYKHDLQSDAETVLHAFTGEDGGYAIGPLARDSSGNLYGVGFNGGLRACPDGCGVVFKIESP